MPELRKDPLVGRWVIFSPERGKRPTDFVSPEEAPSKGNNCPFCQGRENETPLEVYSVRKEGTKPNTPGWSVRVVPNKFPALAPEGVFQEHKEGIYTRSTGVGAHEVIIETPEHNLHLEDQSVEEIAKVLETYQQRMKELLNNSKNEYVLIFKNVGKEAGASLEHPHSQLIATPVLPKRVAEKENGYAAYYKETSTCIFCDMMKQELQEKNRIVYENESFLAFCPYASKFPFQICLLPKNHEANMMNISTQEVKLFADCVKVTLSKLVQALNKPQYNVVLTVGPRKKDFHWHLEILPRVTRIAGFEWGSDFFINPVMPEAAAKDLRQASL